MAHKAEFAAVLILTIFRSVGADSSFDVGDFGSLWFEICGDLAQAPIDKV